MEPELIRQLVDVAQKAWNNAYAPYSNYFVGAAVLAGSGKVYPGANVENASYPLGLCAERVALFSAVAAGERNIRAVALVTKDGGSPCGACRQALAEFGLSMEVIIADSEGVIRRQTTVANLLPDSFGPGNVKP